MIQNLVGVGMNETVACRMMPRSRAKPLTASSACSRSGVGPKSVTLGMEGLKKVRVKISGFSAQPRKSGLARSRIRLADFSAGLADFEVVVALRCSGLGSGEGVAPKFGRHHAGISLEGAIEPSDRLATKGCEP